jgi:hypothetical protein
MDFMAAFIDFTIPANASSWNNYSYPPHQVNRRCITELLTCIGFFEYLSKVRSIAIREMLM